MKKLYFFSLGLIILNIGLSAAQTLNTGDIVVIGYAADTGDAPSVDEFSWMPLVDLTAGTKIYFTDAGYNTLDGHFMGNAVTDEILLRYLVPAGGITAGTIFTLTEASIPPDYTVISGTQFGSDANSTLTLTNSGDQILVFQSTDDENTPATFGNTNFNPVFMVTGSTLSFTALNTNTAGTSTSDIHSVTNLPPGLTDGVNAVAVGTGPLATDESDNARYEGITVGTRDELLFAVSQLSNWGRYDAFFGNDIPFGTAPNGWSANGHTSFIVSPLSVITNDFGSRLLIAPNPSKGNLQISNLSGKEIQKMEVINVTGQVVKSYGQFNSSIDLSGLTAGVYFLKLHSDGAAAIKRIILN